MFGNNLVVWWCCAFLLVASSAKHERNFTNNNEKHDISTAQYKIDENSIKNYDDEKEIDILTIYNFNEIDCNEDSNECFVLHLICASVCYFGFLATYFWLTVMSFDMWWTFRDISSLLQINVRNRQQERERKKKERKKMIMYSVYAWGISFILTIVCVIMDSVPSVTSSLLRPEFGIIIFWFDKLLKKRGLYFWIPSTICSISSICLFISTALKIRRYEKNTTHHLRNVDSRVYDENKNWFNLCEKWFIMMFIVIGISAFIGIVSWIFPYTSIFWYIEYIAQATDMAQNIGIFIIFVCKKRIKKLLLTRFGYQNYNVPPRARQTKVVADSNTRTIRSRMIRLRESTISGRQSTAETIYVHDETAL